MDANHIPIGVATIIVLLAAAYDFRTRHIPNVLTLGGILLGFALAIAMGAVEGGSTGALRGLGHALLGLVVCSAVPLFGFARGELGGGDVKLLAAVGALCGPALGLDAQAFTYAIAVLFVLPWRLVRSGKLAAWLGNASVGVRNLVRRTAAPLPYTDVRLTPTIMGPTIFVGFCLALARHAVLR